MERKRVEYNCLVSELYFFKYVSCCQIYLSIKVNRVNVLI